MSNTVTHYNLFPDTPDTGDPNKLGHDAWVHEHVFAGGADGQVLVWDSAQSDKARWTATPMVTRLGVGGVYGSVDGPVLNLRSVVPGLSDHNSAIVVQCPADYGLGGDKVNFFVNPIGNLYLNTSITIAGNHAYMGTIDSSGNFVLNGDPRANAALNAMLNIYSDTDMAVGWRVSSAPGAYGLQHLDAGSNYVFSIENDGTLMWGASAAGATGTQSHAAMDVALGRDGIDILALKRGTHNTKFRIYGNGTDYLQLSHDGTNTQIGGAAAGNITLGKLLNWNIDSAGLLYPETNNAYDIGISPVSHAPRNIFVAGAMCNRTKSGTPSDSDVTNPTDGMLIVDTSANKLWVRTGGAWKFVAVS